MRELVLANGMVTLVDDDDFARFGGMKWYAVRARQTEEKYYARNRSGWLHRLVMGAPNGLQVDHRDRDGLNNQKANLRLATQSLNNANADMRRRGANTFRGVYWQPAKKSFRIAITVAWKWHSLGTSKSEIEAALRYDTAAREAFGEFAQLNFPDAVAP